MKINKSSNGITHIEELSIRRFLDIVCHLKDYEITEKVDGSQILFGIDENGFYTSRETKGGSRVYSADDYDIIFSNTYRRSAHILLEKMLPTLEANGLKIGDQVEAEVLYGELPNVVPYSKDTSYLIFLRTVAGTADIDGLSRALNGYSADVELTVPITDDGKIIRFQQEMNRWIVSRVPVRKNSLSIRELKPYIREIEKVLQEKDHVTQQSVEILLELPLNKTPNWVTDKWSPIKEHIKYEREHTHRPRLEIHINKIKEILLNRLVRNTGSNFGPSVKNGGWIEGVVLTHRLTGEMVKLVDRDVFGTARIAGWNIRNNITNDYKDLKRKIEIIDPLQLQTSRNLLLLKLDKYREEFYQRDNCSGPIKRTLETFAVIFKSLNEYEDQLLNR